MSPLSASAIFLHVERPKPTPEVLMDAVDSSFPKT